MSAFIKSLTASIASNGTLSEALELGYNGFEKVIIEIPTMSTAAAMKIYGSSDDTTYRYIYNSNPSTNTVEADILTLASSSSGYFTELNTWAPYMKFQVTGTVCAAASIKVFCIYS